MLPESEDPILRPARYQVRAGIGWSLLVSVLGFRLLHHEWRDLVSWWFLITAVAVTVVGTATFVGIRKWQ